MAFGTLRNEEKETYNTKVAINLEEFQNLQEGSNKTSKLGTHNTQTAEQITATFTGAERILDFFPVEADGYTLSAEGFTQLSDTQLSEANIVNIGNQVEAGEYFIQDPRIPQAA